MKNAYRHGHRNGYKRASRYSAVSVRKSSSASGYSSKLANAKVY